MIPEKDLKISFAEMSLRGKKIISQQPEITYADALEQVQRLKANSLINQELRKGRKK